MKKPTILVTGATGRHGGTGPHVVRFLREQQFHVRAMVRQFDDRSDHLRALGAQVVLGDFLSITSLRSVMENVDHVSFSYPIDARHLEAATNMAVVAPECGVHGLVNNSFMPARADHPSSEARQHWLAERLFDWANVGAVHIRGPSSMKASFVGLQNVSPQWGRSTCRSVMVKERRAFLNSKK